MADDTRTETGMSDKDLLDTARRWTGRGELVAGVVVDQLMRIIDGKLPTMPLSRQCPKCRSEMHSYYHDNRLGWHDGCERRIISGRRCPGGRTEHLLWTCGCGFEETTPCADAGEETT